MDFNLFLDILMEDYFIKNRDLAREAGISPSYITKIRSGVRKPSIGGKTFEKIYIGLVNIAKFSPAYSEIMKVIPPTYGDFLKMFLSEKHDINNFSYQLNALMETFNISNSTLANYLHCDASLISKFRTGTRALKHKKHLDQIVEFFVEFIKKCNLEKNGLDKLSNCCSLTLTENCTDESLREFFYNYLRQSRDGNDIYEKIFSLMNFSDPKPDFSKLNALLNNTSLPTEETISKKGFVGLRKLALIGLSTCINSSKPIELKLYSSHDLRWMIEDKDFFELWKLLMLAVIKKGHKIKIFHNILRSEKELYYGADAWLPLQMYGNVESTILDSAQNMVFSNTMFIFGDSFFICGTSIRSLEDESNFILSKNPDLLSQMKKNYAILENSSKPFLKTYRLKNNSSIWDAIIETYSDNMKENYYSVQKNPPIWSIDEDLLNTILKRNGVSTRKCNTIKKYISTIKELFFQRLETSHVYETFYVPESIYLKNELTADIFDVNNMETIYFEPEEYLEHLQSILKIKEKYPSYHPMILKEPIFQNLKLIKNGDNGFVVFKVTSPVSMVKYSNSELSVKMRDNINYKLFPLIKNGDDLEKKVSEYKKSMKVLDVN